MSGTMDGSWPSGSLEQPPRYPIRPFPDGLNSAFPPNDDPLRLQMKATRTLKSGSLEESDWLCLAGFGNFYYVARRFGCRFCIKYPNNE